MPDGPRSVPGRPSLRYLKLEAKRRLAAGEFPALHHAQARIAREHGLSSWAALKQRIASPPQEDGHALAQLRWIISRFADAGTPGWAAPGEQELREHFDGRFLAVIPPAQLVSQISGQAAALQEDLVVLDQAPLHARVRIAGMEYAATAGADPPHRLTGLAAFRVADRIADSRAVAPPRARTAGEVPAEVAAIAEESFTELGVPALALAGGSPGAPAWLVSRGWADLDRAEALDPAHLLPATGVTALVTATAVLRLVADGRVGLDSPANDHLRAVRLADGTITVRELLSHTAGIGNPGGLANPAVLFAGRVPDLAALTGPVIASDGERGVILPGNGGYAVLGQLIADVTGSPYAAAATRLVLEPLGMRRSLFPARPADLGPSTVTGYTVTAEGTFAAVPHEVCTVPAAGGLWAPAADLVGLGTGWASLLPAALAREALTPQAAPRQGEYSVGLGWLISPRGDVAVHAGVSPGVATSLLARICDGQVRVTVTTRAAPLHHVHRRLMRAWARPAH